MPAPEPADLALHPTFLVRTLKPGLAEERLIPVVAAQGHKPWVQPPLPAQQHPDHRRGQVVVTDHPGRHPTQHGERLHMTVQKGLLSLVAVGDMHRLTRMRQAQHEHEQLRRLPTDHGLELAEVDLRLLRRAVSLRHRHQPPTRADLTTKTGHQRPHARLRHLGCLLVQQALPHPPRRMTLLARSRQILGQPPAHRVLMRTQHRSQPDRYLARRRHRVCQRLTHRTPMNPIPASQGTNRQALLAGGTSDMFELLHSRSLLQQPYALRDRLGRRHGT